MPGKKRVLVTHIVVKYFVLATTIRIDRAVIRNIGGIVVADDGLRRVDNQLGRHRRKFVLCFGPPAVIRRLAVPVGKSVVWIRHRGAATKFIRRVVHFFTTAMGQSV